MKSMDDSIGKVVHALREKSMLENTIIVFTTDNGGPAAGFNENAASNWPLRGVKNTLWEGGVRGAALLWSPLLKSTSRVANQRMHIVDWLPTLLEAAGGDFSGVSKIDGVSLWSSLSEDGTFTRSEILHNIDDIRGTAALTVGQWKIVKGTGYEGQWDSWYGPSGRNYTFDINSIPKSKAGEALNSIGRLPTLAQMEHLRVKATLTCTPPDGSKTDCYPLKATCLFNIESDPCEKQNLAKKYPEIVEKLEDILKDYNASAIPPGNLPLDTRGNPKFHNYIWTNFGDAAVASHL